MNIGNIQNLRSMPELGAVRPTPKFPPSEAALASNPQDQVEMGGLSPQGQAIDLAAEAAEPAVPQKSLEDAQKDFSKQLGNLKSQSSADLAYLKEAYIKVNQRTDLNSAQRKYLFATEVQAYALQESKDLAAPERRGQPCTKTEESRFRALADTYGAAKDLLVALEPKVATPDATPPTFDVAAPGSALKGVAAVGGAPASPTSVVSSASASAAPAATGDGSAPPPAPEPSTDPMVRMWEARRQESQDMANDFKTLLQKTTEWKQRIFASRLAFFWKVYGIRASYIAESWRK